MIWIGLRLRRWFWLYCCVSDCLLYCCLGCCGCFAFLIALVVVCASWLLVMFGLPTGAVGSVFNVGWCLGWCFWWFLFACRFIGLGLRGIGDLFCGGLVGDFCLAFG